MGKRDVLSIALKVLGIYFILGTIPIWAQILAWAVDEDHDVKFLWTAMSVAQLCVAAISVALLLWSDRIAAVLCKSPVHSDVGPSTDKYGLQEVAFAVLGLYFLVRSIIAIGAIVASRALFEMPGIDSGPWVRNLISPCIELVIGLWLFLGSRRIVNWLRRGYNAGHAPSPED